MNQQQEDHVRQILRDYIKEYVIAYAKGAKEYGTVMSDLPALQMIQEAKAEARDNYAYNHVAEAQLEKVRTRLTALKESLQESVDDCIANNESVELIEEVYDPVRRINAIERILYG